MHIEEFLVRGLEYEIALLIQGCRFAIMAWVGKWEETHTG